MPYQRTHARSRKGVKAFVDGIPLQTSDTFVNYENVGGSLELADWIVGDSFMSASSLASIEALYWPEYLKIYFERSKNNASAISAPPFTEGEGQVAYLGGTSSSH